ncbi:hypothetical protein ACIA6T_05240 [Streptomyces sp. NPDC051740]|uniref:hypothetical protein n=1 Tax=Streptomyces sp. NPDC051740 TaxID=3365673 RepID=UPI0037B97907
MTLTRLLRRGGTSEPGAEAASADAPVGREGGGEPAEREGGGEPVGREGGGEPASVEEEGGDEPEPVEEEGGQEPGSAADAPDGERARRPPGGRLRRAVLVAAVVALVLGGCGFFHGAHQLRSAASARNHALTDTGATTRVAGDVGNALARVFSYTPDGTAAAERSARTVLDGRAARQYATLFEQVRDDLTEQRVTLSTRAVRTGVVELDGDEARLLVFLDQTSHKGGGKDGVTTAAAQLTVTARFEDDRWRIVDIKAR